MQATDLFLGLLSARQGTIQEPFPQKAEVSSLGRSSFSQTFQTVIGSSKSSYGMTARSADAMGKLEVRPLARKMNEPPQGHQSQIAADSAREAKTDFQATRAESVTRTAQKDPPAESDGNRAAKAEKAGTDSRKATAEEVRRAAGAAGTKAREEASETETAMARETAEDFAARQEELNRKLEALIDKLELAAADKEEEADEEALLELIAQILAVLLAEDAKTGEAGGTAEGADKASEGLAIQLDAESGGVAEVLKMLLADSEGLDKTGLEDVKVLLKLADGKGLMIPLSEILRDGAEAGEDTAVKFTVELAEADGGSSKLELAISTQDIKAAQLVDLSQTPVKDSDLVMTIPLEKLLPEGEKSLDALAQKLEQGEVGEGLKKLLDTLGLTRRELAQALAAKEDDAAGRVRVQVPLQPAEGSQGSKAAPAISTADPMFIHSDDHLAALEMQALAKEVSDAAGERRELYARLQNLIAKSGDSSDVMSRVMIKTATESMLLKDWLGDLAQQAKQDTREWSSSLFKDTLMGETRTKSTSDPSMSTRIPFLGRSAVQEGGLNQVLESRAEMARSTSQGEKLDEMVMRQIVQRVSYNFVNGKEGEVRVLLRPGSLGDVNVKVRAEQDVITAKITAQSHEVKAIIENNLGQLKDQLAQQGVKVAEFEVTVDNGSDNSAHNGAEERTGDDYSTAYSSGLDADGIQPGEAPDVFDGDYAYSRGGTATGLLSRYNYLA